MTRPTPSTTSDGAALDAGLTETAILGVDWGGSKLSAYHVNRAGDLVSVETVARGVLGASRAQLAETLGGVLARGPAPGGVILSGMICSSVGWQATPYCETPATLDDVARACVRAAIAGRTCLLAPGLSTRGGDGAPDTMRGEEMEVFGLTLTHAALATGAHLIVLPGTHTKWVRLEDARITGFATAMSGELFDLMTRGGVLADVAQGRGEAGAAFDAGVAAAQAAPPRGLARLMFGARAKALVDGVDGPDTASYLRGLLIGSEISAMCADQDLMGAHVGARGQAGVITLVGNAGLSTLYARAGAAFGLTLRPVDASAGLAAAYAAVLTRANA